MTTNHIDQLTEWWETAEKGAVQKGDIVIERVEDGQYNVFTAFESEAREYDEFRILARAPKPEPAWHDAVAVLARSASEADQSKRAVWTWDAAMERWYDEGGCHWANTDDLRDVTPLIEAKVTDEMVTRAQVEMMRLGLGDYSDRTLASILAAALGLDPA